MNKFYDLLKYIIYASFYVIVIKTGMDFYEYKRFPETIRTEFCTVVYGSVTVLRRFFCGDHRMFRALRVIIKRKMKKG